MGTSQPPAGWPSDRYYRIGQRQRFENKRRRFCTFSCLDRLPLFNHEPLRWMFLEALERCCASGMFELHAWVLMPEHEHLVFTPDRRVKTARILQALKGPFAKTALEWLRTNVPASPASRARRFWLRGGGHVVNLPGSRATMEAIGYIHANPVRRGLVARSTDWSWSSARWYAGDRSPPSVQIVSPRY